MKYHYKEAVNDRDEIFDKIKTIEKALEESNNAVKKLTTNFTAEGKFAESLKAYLDEVNIVFIDMMREFIDKYKEEYDNLLDKAKDEIDSSSKAILYESKIKNIDNAHLKYNIENTRLINEYNKTCGNVSKYITSTIKHEDFKCKDTLNKMIDKIEEFSSYDSREPIDKEYWAVRKFVNYMNKTSINMKEKGYASGDVKRHMKQYLQDEREINKDNIDSYNNINDMLSILNDLSGSNYTGKIGKMGFAGVLLGIIADLKSGKNIGGAFTNNLGPYTVASLITYCGGGPSVIIGSLVSYVHDELYKSNYTYKDIVDHGADLIWNTDVQSYNNEIKRMKDAGYIYSYKDGYFVKAN